MEWHTTFCPLFGSEKIDNPSYPPPPTKKKLKYLLIKKLAKPRIDLFRAHRSFTWTSNLRAANSHALAVRHTHGPSTPRQLWREHDKRFYSCITAWFGNCPASDRKALQSVVRTAQYITGVKLPAIQNLYTRQCQRKALKIVRLQPP
jgi:hypothetical protein